ncbi:hypothetical protein OE165_27035, partial [Escherichia coli]|uniref:hypothetical protein n=1 Tax=Escherichia coli TaxID=562 RepID=UPI0021F39A0F
GTLPAYLTAGCGVGLQNPVGNGTPDAAAGGLRVVTRVNATTLIVEFQSRGVVPLVNMTTPTAGTTYGMVQNQLIVPLSCIRANSAGWTARG